MGQSLLEQMVAARRVRVYGPLGPNDTTPCVKS